MTEEEFLLSLINTPTSSETASKVERTRSSAKSFGLAIFREAPASPERNIAIQKLREAEMWAAAAISTPRQQGLFQ